MNAIVPFARMRPSETRVSWGAEEIETVKRLSAEGKSATEIAGLMSAKYPYVTRNSVIGKLHRMGCAGGGRQPNRDKALGNLKPPIGVKVKVRRAPQIARRNFQEYPRGASGTARKAPSQVHPDQDFRSRPATIPEADPFIGIEFVEIKDGLCRWPRGEPYDLDNFRFCGVTSGEAVYCPFHSGLAYNGTARPFAKATERTNGS